MFNRLSDADRQPYPISVKTRVPRCDVKEVQDPFEGEIFVPQQPFYSNLTNEWDVTCWWRVLNRAGSIVLETKYEDEARAAYGEGCTLQRLYQKTEERWVSER